MLKFMINKTMKKYLKKYMLTVICIIVIAILGITLLYKGYNSITSLFGAESKDSITGKLYLERFNNDTLLSVNNSLSKSIDQSLKVSSSNQEAVILHSKDKMDILNSTIKSLRDKVDKLEKINSNPQTVPDIERQVSEVQIDSLWDKFCEKNCENSNNDYVYSPT